MSLTIDLPPPGQVTDEETGRRFYEIDGQNFWSVTTALDVLGSDALKFWAAGLAATFAFDELPTILTASRTRPCGRAYARCQHDRHLPHIPWECACQVCEECIRRLMTDLHKGEAARRADEGRRVHRVIAWWALNAGEWIGADDDIAPYVKAFALFVEAYGLTPDSWEVCEAVVINREFRYAGTTDGIVRIDAAATPAAAELVARLVSRNTGTPVTAAQAAERRLTVLVLLDFKTREKTVEGEKFYPDHALQLVGYRKAETIRIRNTEVEEPMPVVDGTLLVSLRLDGVTPRLTVSDDVTFGGFLHALGLFMWLTEFGTASVSTRSFPLPKPPTARAPRGTRRPAAEADDLPVGTGRGKPAGSRKRPVPVPPATPGGLGRLGLGYTPPAGARLTDDDIPF